MAAVVRPGSRPLSPRSLARRRPASGCFFAASRDRNRALSAADVGWTGCLAFSADAGGPGPVPPAGPGIGNEAASLATMRAVRLSAPGAVGNLRLTTLPPAPSTRPREVLGGLPEMVQTGARARHGLLRRQPLRPVDGPGLLPERVPAQRCAPGGLLRRRSRPAREAFQDTSTRSPRALGRFGALAVLGHELAGGEGRPAGSARTANRTHGASAARRGPSLRARAPGQRSRPRRQRRRSRSSALGHLRGARSSPRRPRSPRVRPSASSPRAGPG